MVNALIINLPNQISKFESTKRRLLNALPHVNVQRMHAVDGRLLTSDQKRAMATPFCSKHCTPSMIGCFLSHKDCWKIAASSTTPTLILEDDAVFHPSLHQYLPYAMAELPLTWDILYVGCFTCEHETLVDHLVGWAFAQRNSMTAYSPHLNIPRMALGSHAYFVSPSGASKLIQLLPRATNHVDLAITAVFDNLNVFSCRENLAMQNPNNYAKSDIAGQVPLTLNWALSGIKIDKDGRRLSWIMSQPFVQLFNCAPISGWTLLFAMAGTKIPIRYTAGFLLVDFVTGILAGVQTPCNVGSYAMLAASAFAGAV